VSAENRTAGPSSRDEDAAATPLPPEIKTELWSKDILANPETPRRRRWRFDWGFVHGFVVGATIEYDGLMLVLGFVWVTLETYEESVWLTD
jgi:hypothetical protein